MNAQRACYFKDWPKKDTCYACADDTYFHEANHANAHAGNLKVKDVDTLTRADYDAWLAGDTEQQLTNAKTELEAASGDLKLAQAAADAMPAKTPVKSKAAIMKTLNNAKARVANAQLAVDELTVVDAPVADAPVVGAAVAEGGAA